MKIRLMGSDDLVRAWAKRFAAQGIRGSLYPMRGGKGLRWYADIDDRLAAEVADGDIPPRRQRSRLKQPRHTNGRVGG